MLKIDNSLLEEVGLGGLPDSEKNSFLKHIYETLEMRVGVRLADQMTNQQLDEFEQYFEAKDVAGAFQWLEANFPNYKDIVQQEFDKLKNEISQTAPQILAASQSHANQAPPSQAEMAPSAQASSQPADDMSFGTASPSPQPAATPLSPPQQQPPYPSEQPPAGSQSTY